ncbi:MAG: DUF6559 family protein [Burkholderiaceae bacterium]
MKVYERWRRSRAKRKIVRRLPQLLESRYGADKYYSAGQIDTTLKVGRFSAHYQEYAYALAMPVEAAAKHFRDKGVAETLRTEIANEFFCGNLAYSMDTALGLSKVRARGNDMSGGGSDGTHLD